MVYVLKTTEIDLFDSLHDGACRKQNAVVWPDLRELSESRMSSRTYIGPADRHMSL